MTGRLKETEAGFTTRLVQYAQLHGWLVHHDRPARIKRRNRHTGEEEETWRTAIEGDTGFPDLVLVGHHRMIVAELKCGRNSTSDRQDEWLYQFRRLGHGCAQVEIYLWKPADWDNGTIERILGGRHAA